jgi:hypothetical protein
MSNKSKWITGTLLAAGLTLSGTTAAMAGVTPSPSPSQQTQTPPQYQNHHKVRAQLWQFDFSSVGTDGLAFNNVRGTGAIPMTRWQETDNSPFTSTFSLGANSVTILHPRLPIPVINLRTCTATFDQESSFSVIRGTGTGANFRVVPGTSDYILRGTVSLDLVQKRYHRVSVCPLSRVSPFLLRFLIEHNLPVAGQFPSLQDFDAQGNAQLVRVRPLVIPTPTPTGPGHFFQTNNPTVNPNPDNSLSA